MNAASNANRGSVISPSVAEGSFLLFVYPFLFEPASFAERVSAVDEASIKSGAHSLKVWNEDRFPSGDMLSSVANYLNPPEKAEATARLWRMNWALRDAFGLSDRGVWDLKLRNKTIPFTLGRSLAAGEKEAAGSFAFKLAMFQGGVGFLTVSVTPKTREVDDWLDFVHYFRYINRPSDATISAVASQTNRQHKDGEKIGPVTQAGTFNSLIESLLDLGQRRTVESAGESQWWSEVFVPEQALPYAALFVDDWPKDDDLLLAYRLRNFFHSGQTVIPSAHDLSPDHPDMLSYADRQRFIFSLDGGAFLAADAPIGTFFRQTLPDHLRDYHFLVYLLTLYQRFFLMSLQKRITEKWVKAGAADRVRAFEETRELLLEFTARSIFPQVMQREHHHKCYRKWQEVFQIDELYREVRLKVTDMYEYSLLRLTESEERSQKRIEALVAILGTPAIVLGFLGVNIIDVTSEEGMRLEWVIALTFLSAFLGWALVSMLRRWRA